MTHPCSRILGDSDNNFCDFYLQPSDFCSSCTEEMGMNPKELFYNYITRISEDRTVMVDISVVDEGYFTLQTTVTFLTGTSDCMAAGQNCPKSNC